MQQLPQFKIETRVAIDKGTLVKRRQKQMTAGDIWKSITHEFGDELEEGDEIRVYSNTLGSSLNKQADEIHFLQ